MQCLKIGMNDFQNNKQLRRYKAAEKSHFFRVCCFQQTHTCYNPFYPAHARERGKVIGYGVHINICGRKK